MTWRWVKGRKAQAGRVALMRGPMVYCLRRKGNEQLKDVDLREITIVPATLEGPIAGRLRAAGRIGLPRPGVVARRCGIRTSNRISN